MRIADLIKKLEAAQVELGNVEVHYEGGAISVVDGVWPDGETVEHVYLG